MFLSIVQNSGNYPLQSRKIVGWEVHHSDHSDHAIHLVRRKALTEGIAGLSFKPVLHGDNGSTLKATTVSAQLAGSQATPGNAIWPHR